MPFGSNAFPLRIPVEAVDRFTIPFGRIAGALDAFGHKAEKLGKKLSIGLSAPIVAFQALAGHAGLEWQKSLNNVQAVTGATAEELAALQERVEGALGKKGIPTTAKESAGAMIELARAGQTLEEVEQNLPGVIELATAAQEDQAVAAKDAADVLLAYQLQAKDAAEVTDLLAFASARGKQQLSPLVEGLVAAAPAARTFDQDLRTTVASLNAIARAGKEGGSGARIFGQMLARIRKPSGEALKGLKSLTIEAEDLSTRTAEGVVKLRPFDEILGTLRAHGLDSSRSLSIFGTKLGAVAFRVVQSSGEVGDFTEKLKEAGGQAETLAKVQLGGAVGPLAEFEAKWHNLLVTVARSGLLDAMARFATKAGEILDWISHLNPAILRWGVRLGGIAAILGPALVAIGQLSLGLSALSKLAALPAFAGLGARLAGILGAAAPWATLAVSIGVIAYNVKNLLDTLAGRSSRALPEKIDRPAMDEFAFPAGPAAGAGRVRAVGAGGTAAAGGAARADVSGRIQVDLQGLPPGARVRARQTGDVPIDVDAGYVLAAGLSG